MVSSIPVGYSLARGLPNEDLIGWDLRKSDELFQLVYGKALTATSRVDGDVPVYGTNGQCGTHNEALFKGPGVIVGRKGQGPLGVEYCKTDYWVIDTAYSLSIREDVLLEYAYYMIKYVGLNHLKDGSSNPTLSRDSFGRQMFPLPPMAQQRAIARVLGAIDDKIELNCKANETLEAIAQALFKSWFVNFEPVKAKAEGRPTGLPDDISALFSDSFEDSELGEVPTGWPVASVVEMVEIDPKRNLRKGAIAPYLEMKGVPVRGHCAEGVIQREFTSGSKFVNDDTLLARITPCLENGKTAYVDFLADGEVGWGSTEFIVLCGKPQVAGEFVYYLARSEAFRAFAIQNMVGSSGRQRVPADCFNSYLMPLPPQPLMDAFADFAAGAIEGIRRNANESNTLAQIRDTLLPKLISGELRVPDAEAAMEAVGV